MRRKPGGLVPLELEICLAAANLRHEFHGYEIAKRLKSDADSRLLIAHGTLYRALGRLEQMGLVESRWEDPAISARENRPRRRLYTLTAEGEVVGRDARTAARKKNAKLVKGRLAPA